jgi:hypothetical protein
MPGLAGSQLSDEDRLDTPVRPSLSRSTPFSIRLGFARRVRVRSKRVRVRGNDSGIDGGSVQADHLEVGLAWIMRPALDQRPRLMTLSSGPEAADVLHVVHDHVRRVVQQDFAEPSVPPRIARSRIRVSSLSLQTTN